MESKVVKKREEIQERDKWTVNEIYSSDEAQIYVEELLKTIQEQTGSAIVQKKEERYSFVEITD